MRANTPEETLAKIQPGHRVFVHGGAATPLFLLAELVRQAERLHSIELIHLHTEGPAMEAEPTYKTRFRTMNLFVGRNLRDRIDYSAVDYIPCFLSEIPELFRVHRLIDVALLHLSPPDRHGYCSLGVSVDIARAAVASAKIRLAQINSRMPRVHGDGWLHISNLDAFFEIDEPLPNARFHEPSPEENTIARHIAELVEDGSTLQMGIGAIPDAVARLLTNHKNLGIHSEMWSDGALELIQSGAVNNALKKVHPGKSVSGFLIGQRPLYDFIHENPSVFQLGMDYVNNPQVIARNPKVVAINSAVEIDLSGQVCADSIGCRIISGVGGQIDFMRGARLSPGGKPIIAMTSTTRNGGSKIVNQLKPGAGVVTTRADVHFVVTEYGVAQLHGLSLGERAKALIRLAHPKHREALERAQYQT